MKNGYRLVVYKRDRRFLEGERLVNTYDYEGYSGDAMQDEIFSLQQHLYKPADGWRLEFEPMTKTVISLMTGQPVVIDYRTPHACDPSTETYWSM